MPSATTRASGRSRMTASASASAGSMCPAVPPPATTTHGPLGAGCPVKTSSRDWCWLIDDISCIARDRGSTGLAPNGPGSPRLAATVLRRRSGASSHTTFVDDRKLRGAPARCARRRGRTDRLALGGRRYASGAGSLQQPADPAGTERTQRRHGVGLVPRAVREDAEHDHGRHDRRAAGGDHRQRDAGDRQQPHDVADVDRGLRDQPHRQRRGHDPDPRVGVARRDPQADPRRACRTAPAPARSRRSRAPRR